MEIKYHKSIILIDSNRKNIDSKKGSKQSDDASMILVVIEINKNIFCGYRCLWP